MPTPGSTETKEGFIDRCIPIVIEDGTAADGSQANAICNSMWEEAMKANAKTVYGDELSEEEKVDEVGRAFRNQFPFAELPGGFVFDPWVIQTFSQVVIVDERSKFYAVPYTRGDEIKFASFPEWEEVEKDTTFETKAEMLTTRFASFMIAKIKTAGDMELDVLAVPFGGPDFGKDKQGEFFTPRTDLALDNFENPLVVYYHGFDENQQQMKTPEIIGEVTSHETKADGHWVRILLDKTNEFAKRIWEAAKKGLAKASSGTIGHLMRSEFSGEITYWPLAEITLLDTNETMQPANAYAVVLPVMKALYVEAGITLPDILGPRKPQAKAKGGMHSAKADEAESRITYAKRMQLKGRAFLIGD